MLLAEDLILLATDEATGKSTVSMVYLEPALAGAVLLDLTVGGKVSLQGEGKRARVVVIDPTPSGEPVLDFAVQSLLGKDPQRAVYALRRIGKGLRERLHESLERRGLLRRETGTMLLLIPTTRWPATDSTYEVGVRQQVANVLLLGQEPDQRIASIISLLTAADMLRTVVDRSDMKAARARGKEIGQGNWASDSVRKAIQETQAAVMAAIVVTTTAAASG